MSAANDAMVEQFVGHLVRLAQVDKHYAWWAAGNYESLWPGALTGLRQRLTERMQALQNNKEEQSHEQP